MPAKAIRKFREYDSFAKTAHSDYYLLPFRFHRISAGTEVLVNDLGDFLLVPTGTVSRIIGRKVTKNTDAELYMDLCSAFFISEEPIPALVDLMATRYRTRKSFLDRFTSLHIFVISLRCDHSCQYCQVSRVSEDKHAFDMQKIYIDKGIDIMMRSPSSHVTMEFQGGEALLAFEKIQYAVERTKQLALECGKTVTYVICTNLTPLTLEILAYCKANDLLISTSLDGPAFIHNANRYRPKRNSYELAVEGIRLCRDELGSDKVSALLTTTNLTLEHPEAVVDEYISKGFSSIFLRPISPYGFALKSERKNHYDMSRFLTFYKIALEKIIQHNRKGFFFREDYATIILRKILTPFPVGYVDLQSPAGLINSVIVFNYNGKVYASDEARMLAEMNDDQFCLGSLTEHTYEELFYGPVAQSIARAWANESLAGCSSCAFQPFCGADPVYHHATQGDMYGHRPSSGFCQKNMEIIRYLFELMQDNSVRQIFYNWINGTHHAAEN